MPKEECNKYDITVSLSVFVIGQGGLLLVVSHLFAEMLGLNIMCGVAEK
jgi:hypothetical protein